MLSVFISPPKRKNSEKTHSEPKFLPKKPIITQKSKPELKLPLLLNNHYSPIKRSHIPNNFDEDHEKSQSVHLSPRNIDTSIISSNTYMSPKKKQNNSILY